MTTEEKLEKAIEFIKSIEQLDLPFVTTSDILDGAHVYCAECGDECEVDYSGSLNNYVEASEVGNLKDRAWHLLVDLVD